MTFQDWWVGTMLDHGGQRTDTLAEAAWDAGRADLSAEVARLRAICKSALTALAIFRIGETASVQAGIREVIERLESALRPAGTPGEGERA